MELILNFCEIIMMAVIIRICPYLSTCPFLDCFLFCLVTTPMLHIPICSGEILHTSLHVKTALNIIASEHFQIILTEFDQILSGIKLKSKTNVRRIGSLPMMGLLRLISIFNSSVISAYKYYICEECQQVCYLF